MLEGKAQSAHDLRGVGQRIRFLRGALSQAAFAAKVGVTRSALANYETGRTSPGPEVVKSIAGACGVGPSFLTDGTVQSVEEFATSLGITYGASGSFSDDELAFLRVLAISDATTLRKVVITLIEGLKQDRNWKDLADPVTLPSDLVRLVDIAEGRDFHRSRPRENFPDLLKALDQRLRDLSQ